MFRNLLASVLLAAAVCGAAAAEEISGLITKVEDGKVTFMRFKEGDPQSFQDAVRNGKEASLPAAATVKVFHGKGIPGKAKIERGEVEVPDGLKNEQLKNVGKGGKYGRMFPAKMITDDSGKAITEIHVLLPKETPGKK